MKITIASKGITEEQINDSCGSILELNIYLKKLNIDKASKKAIFSYVSSGKQKANYSDSSKGIMVLQLPRTIKFTMKDHGKSHMIRISKVKAK